MPLATTLLMAGMLTGTPSSVAPGLPGSDDNSVHVEAIALDEHALATLSGRYELPDGLSLLFGLAQSLSVDGVQRWSTQWQVSVAGPHLMPVMSSFTGVANSTTLPPVQTVIENRLDGATLQHLQTLTVEVDHLGNPSLNGLASRLTRTWIPGQP